MTNSNSLTFTRIRLVYCDAINGNFLRLPSNLASVLESSGIPIHEFGILLQPKACYLGWDGHESTRSVDGEPVIEIKPALAHEYQLSEGQLVDINVTHYNKSLVASEVHVEPITADDWEIVLSNATFFQDEILLQTRILSPGSKLLCYIDQIVARFTVKKIVPENLASARISTDTELVIAPKEHDERKNMGKPSEIKGSKSGPSKSAILQRSSFYLAHGRGLIVGLPDFKIQSKMAMITAIRNPLEVPHAAAGAPGSVSNANNAESVISGAPSSPMMTSPTHRIAAQVVPDSRLKPNQVSLSADLWKCLGLTRTNGERVKVEFVSEVERDDLFLTFHYVLPEQQTKKLTIGGLDSHREARMHRAQELVDKLQHWVLTDKLLLPGEEFFIELRSQEGGEQVSYARPGRKRPIEWRLSKHPLEVPSWRLQYSSTPTVSSREVVGVEEIAEHMLNFLCSPVGPICQLVHGRKGMGKTALLKHVAYRLQSEHDRNTTFVDCNSLLDTGNITKMKKTMQQILAIAYWKAPSVLLLDNADFLFPNARSPEDTGVQNSASYMNQPSTKLAQMFIVQASRIANKSGSEVNIILSAEREDSICPLFSTKHFIAKKWVLNLPGRIQREKLFNHFFASKNLGYSDSLGAADLALETEGYSPADLSILVDKLFHETLCSKDSLTTPRFPLSIDRSIFDFTISGYTPSSLRGIKLQKNTGVKWDDIGALRTAKNILLETLEWPTKYAPVFSRCPLRLRSGLLLYGYPGCGKTLLASAVAQQCGLNFISIKGPEILNKYIGASEQSVRELFEKAQAAKPCVLFFDEFDSIAPKRGHDSTGVTDRVVNQLLTQMDGAEGLDGVYVLAATSRPDLIDPALLRPGRLDKSILCGMPDKTERAEILRAVVTSGNMLLESNVEFDVIAERTIGFSGADLQSMCYNAYLRSVHRSLLSNTNDTYSNQTQIQHDYVVINGLKSMNTLGPTDKSLQPSNAISRLQSVICSIPAAPSELSNRPELLPYITETEAASTINNAPETRPKITLDDISAACTDTRPSISKTEQYKLQRIYSKFANDRDGEMPTGEASQDIGGRATLM